MRVPRPRFALSSAVVLAVLALSSGCRRGAPAEEATRGPYLVGPENLAVVTERSIQSGPRIAGSLQPLEQAVIRAQVAGSVMEVLVDRGAPVKAGQILARIEGDVVRGQGASAQSAVRSAEAQLALARTNVKRAEKLVSQGVLPEAELDAARNNATAAQAQLAAARAQRTSAQQQLGDATVRSPIDGVVSVRAIGRGDVVALGSPLYTIIDPRTMRLEGAVPSDSFAGIVPGTPVTFQVRGLGDQTFEGQVMAVSPVADEVTRQIAVTVSLPNPEQRLIAGLFAEGRVAVKSRRGLAVPVAAVDLAAPTPTVSRIRAGKVERVAVTLGTRDDGDDWIEITSGLAKGEQVLVGEARGLAPGSPVEIVTERRGEQRADADGTTRGG